ncbi:hypothetical protein AZE42_13353, partial [Rhizopogon vesiculosus]
MVYTRAPASDYDDWGADGWESRNVIPLMKKVLECVVCVLIKLNYYGPIKVSTGGGKLGLFDEFVHVGTTYHKRSFADDTEDLETCNVYSPWAKYICGTTGRRSDAAHHYFYNQAHNPNLQLWAGKRVRRIIFEGKRAVGVEFTSDPVSCPEMDHSLSTVRASKLVVISAGAFGSPTILERSGVGAEAILKRCGIEQVANLPGVGENYRDHHCCGHPYFVADGVVTMDPLWRGDESVIQAFQPRWKEFFQDRPDKAVAIFGLMAGYAGRLSSDLPPRNYMTATCITLYPASTG